MRKFYILIISFLFTHLLFAQKMDTYVRGQVLKDSIPLAKVHIYNLHNQLYTTTNDEGYFVIKAVAGNILQLTHVGLKTIVRKIQASDFDASGFVVQMQEDINELEGVEVSEKDKITAQSLGIIQHTPKKRTFTEKRLYTASSGSIFNLFGLVNKITGRTKMLKQAIANEKNMAVASYIQNYMGDFLKKELKISDEEVRFLSYYVMEEPEIHRLVYSRENEHLQFTLLEYWAKAQRELEEDE